MKHSNVSIEYKNILEYAGFVDEMRAHIDCIDEQLQTYLLYAEPIPDTSSLLRSMHSFKGTAGFWGMHALQEAAHRAETCLLEIEDAGRAWSEPCANMMVYSCQELRNLLQLPFQGASFLAELPVSAKAVPVTGLENAPHWHLSFQGIDEADDLQGLKCLLGTMPDCVQLVDVRALGEDHQSWTLLSTLHPDELSALVKMHVSQKTRTAIAPMSASFFGRSFAGGKGLAKSLRVSVDALSGLQDIARQLARLQGTDSSPHLAALALDFHLRLSDIRLVRVTETLERYEPMVLALAQRLKKKIVWHLQGGNTQVDRRLMERINEVLLHLVRNSCDHGIEAEYVRLASGKLAVGHIRLDVFRSDDGLHFNLTDDGAGLSRQALLARALRQGLPIPDNTADDAEIWPFIFEPGFSTASQVTDISGRGVGLDVVRQTILDLGGRVQVQSKAGEGLTFAITVPDPTGW
jgi:chemotaxis protein histidine kinase CheA